MKRIAFIPREIIYRGKGDAVMDRLEPRYRDRRGPPGRCMTLLMGLCCVAIVVFIILAFMYADTIS